MYCLQFDAIKGVFCLFVVSWEIAGFWDHKIVWDPSNSSTRTMKAQVHYVYSTNKTYCKKKRSEQLHGEVLLTASPYLPQQRLPSAGR